MTRGLAILLAVTLIPPVLVIAALSASSGTDFITPTLMVIVFAVFVMGALFEIKRLADRP
jgi:hypothetical protein